MPTSTSKLRVLLLQARTADDPAKIEERESFAKKSDLAVEQIVPHDLLSGPPSLDRARSFDALMVGGSGDFYVSKRDLPHLDATLDFLREITELDHPTFASCFGFQCLVEAYGGAIVHDPDNTEVGTYALTLTDAGACDPLLGSLPPTFAAQMGRKDRADSLPEGFHHLASSKAAPYQAIRLRDAPIWATQFHPELDQGTNRGRYFRYLDGYAPNLDESEHAAILERFESSPEAEALLRRFIDVVFG